MQLIKRLYRKVMDTDMAILKIARMGHPALMGIARPVADPRAPEIHQLIGDMIDTMDDAPGIGLAAPQVHTPLRIVVFRVPPGREAEVDVEDDVGVPLTVLINPEIEALSDELATGVEGCLSLPGMIGRVPRHTHIRYRALAPDGGVIERTATGFHARVVQHECDHLDGVLYPMRMDDLSSLGYADEISRDWCEDGEAEEDYD